MITESVSANFIKQLSTLQLYPVEKGYFRSKLIVTDAFTNPLIAAASPLISLLERIHIAAELPELQILHENINHEFKAFYCRFHRHNYSEEFHFFANYLLCATADEILGRSYLRLNDEPMHFKAFTPPSSKDIHPEQYFFEITHYVITHAEQFLDLVELAYFCLLIGFEGQYHQQTNGRVYLDNLIENLFQTIQKHRTNKKYKLFKTYVLKNNLSKSKISAQKILLALGISVLTLFFLSQYFIVYETTKTLNDVSFKLESL
jgi:type VI secretion system protein ImpK